MPERSEAPAAPEEDAGRKGWKATRNRPARSQAFQRPEQLAGHLGGLSALQVGNLVQSQLSAVVDAVFLQGQAAVAAMHVSRWQEAGMIQHPKFSMALPCISAESLKAMNIAAARGDRATCTV